MTNLQEFRRLSGGGDVHPDWPKHPVAIAGCANAAAAAAAAVRIAGADADADAVPCRSYRWWRPANKQIRLTNLQTF